MLEIIAVSLLLIISIFLAIINWRIFTVTVLMLEVTIDIYHKTENLFTYTKKTYEVLGGEEGLTTFPKNVTMIQTKEDEDGL